MFRTLANEAEVIEHRAEDLCKEAEETVEDFYRQATDEARELYREAEEKLEEVEEEIEEEVGTVAHKFAASDGLAGDSLQNIKRSLTASEDTLVPEKHWIVDSIWFQASVTCITLCNTLQMGLEVDYPDWTTCWLICENVFTAGFALEMVIKICVYKWHYFTDTANWLDGTLSVFGVLDVWILEALAGGAGGVDLQSLSVLRILRLLRLARILKLMRGVKPLVLVIQGVIKAMSTAIYVLILCVLIFYVFAIFLTQHMGKSNNHLYPGYSIEEDTIDEQEFMANYNPYICFGSMVSSMLTLFNMAILAEWAEIIRPVFYKQPWYLPVFLFFATCVGFGVMNVLIAVIVDVVTAESRRIETDLADQVKKKKLKTLDRIQTLLSDIDRNQDGVMEEDELAFAMTNNTQLQELMATIDLPRGWSSNELLDMLDNNGDGVLQYGEFTTSFFRLLDSDDFQQICIMQSSINQLKHMVREQLATNQVIIQQDLASIKTALGIASSKPERQITPTGEVQQQSLTKETPLGEPYKSRSEQQINGEYTGSKVGALSNIIREITKEELVGCAHDASYEPQETELISRTQLIKILSSALTVVKECIHEEFASVRPGLESEPRRSAPEFQNDLSFKQSSLVEAVDMRPLNTVEPVRAVEIQAGHTSKVHEAGIINHSKGVMLDSRPAQNHDSSNIQLVDESLGLAHHVDSADIQYDRCEYQGNDKFATLSKPIEPDFGIEGQTPEVDYPEYHVHDFTFDEGAQRLGFEIHWIRDGFPVVAKVVPDGAANLQGVLEGDQLAACNGLSTFGKDRQTVLQALVTRPVVLSILRA